MEKYTVLQLTVEDISRLNIINQLDLTHIQNSTYTLLNNSRIHIFLECKHMGYFPEETTC